VSFTITVQELPVPNLGTRVLVRVNDELAFQAHLAPRHDLIEQTAVRAVQFANRLLQTLTDSPSTSF
jgi:hypothetical protein